jgi:hypothetical protein
MRGAALWWRDSRGWRGYVSMKDAGCVRVLDTRAVAWRLRTPSVDAGMRESLCGVDDAIRWRDGG